MKDNPYADLPQIEILLTRPEVGKWFPLLSRPYVSLLCSQVLEKERDKIRQENTSPGIDSILDQVEHVCRSFAAKRLQRVVNATGIVLHTNMGRSPVPESIWKRAEAVNTGYSSLEFDLERGKRGHRGGIVSQLLCLLTGAEAALVVNNNAAAVYLILNALAKGKEVVVSRGEQVQIGGGFRIPDILAQSGACLVEVGTTNITSVQDYIDAVTERTGMALSVHPSNFFIKGFTGKPDLAELARALPEGVILTVDQGSGVTTEQIQGEFSALHAVKAGAHLVCFSGDKVFGGPQAGIIVGKADLIEILGKHPLMRIIRPGKTVFSLLQEFLLAKLNKNCSSFVEQVLNLSEKELTARGREILSGLDSGSFTVVPSTILAGGGSSPEKELPSQSIRIELPVSPDSLLRRLRNYSPPVIGTIKDNAVLLNLATLLPEDVKHLRNVLINLSSTVLKEEN